MQYIAWTGHRPKDLPGITYMQFRDALNMLGFGERVDLHFVTGGALGVDTWATEYALTHAIPYTIILPFQPKVMGSMWNPAQRATLEAHIEHARDVQIILDDGTYAVEAYQRRNIEMINRAQHVMACWTGKASGGTANAVRYALKVGKPVYNVYPLNGRLRKINSLNPA